jgi:uncharacterized cupin superfamily protein
VPRFYASNIDATEYVRADPEGGQEILDGDTNWMVHWLRQSSGPGAAIAAGMVTGDEAVARMRFDENETVIVLEGEADVEIDGKDVVELRPGVIASFVKGTDSVWTIRKQLKQFFIISG